VCRRIITKKSKQRFGELEFKYFGGSDVANRLDITLLIRSPNFGGLQIPVPFKIEYLVEELSPTFGDLTTKKYVSFEESNKNYLLVVIIFLNLVR
jgi:hypothetical protein